MNRPSILTIIGLLIVSFSIGLLVGNWISGNKTNVSGAAVNDYETKYVWTRAICTQGDCIDVEITCERGKVTGLQPVSDYVRHEVGWTDPRNVSEYC